MPTDPGVLTATLKEFVTVFSQGYGRIYPDAFRLFMELIALEIILFGIAMVVARQGAEAVVEGLIWKAVKIGALSFILQNFSWLSNMVITGFITLGLKAGGSTMTLEEFTNPSKIAQLGLVASEPLWQHVKSYGVVGYFFNLWDVLLSEGTGFLIILTYFWFGILIFVSFIEFYLMAVVCVILLPFSGWNVTSFLGEKAMGYVVSFALRCGVLAFIASAAFPILIGLKLEADPRSGTVWAVVLGAGAITYLAWHFSSVVGGLAVGSPQTSSAMIASSVGSLALAVGGLARIATNAGRSAVSSVRAGAQLGRRIL